ncbi:MAG TPA: nicotinate-nucleotide adenylyltransferase [Methylomirabilota bacterium]|nr:nicotinate-nucleotide adenylyltransferase [Methylomirabilota bacterium]
MTGISANSRPRIGIFGGSFNPVHFGHLLLADDIAESLGLDRVIFVPAAQPPHKPSAELAPAEHRYRMTALAVSEHPRFEVCDLELNRPGPSYTVDTLEALAERGDLHLLIGSETFLDLLGWREPRRIARLSRLVVAPRSGTGFDPEAPAAQKVLAELGLPGWVGPAEARAGMGRTEPILLPAASLPISGSDLRRRAREGKSLAYRMPESVAAYIREHRLYQSEAR